MKVKHLIKKLSELDPEANVYLAEGPAMIVRPCRYAHYGLYLKRDRIFILERWTKIQGMYSDKAYMDKLLDHNKMDKTSKPEDVLLSSWNGDFGDD